MAPFQTCPVCGGELVQKAVEKLLRGGNDVAVVTIVAEVCLRCGERLYSLETVERLDAIRGQLERQDTSSFRPLGRSFQVV